MYNPEQKQQPQFMAPRMSFSSDFALEPPPPRQPGSGRTSTGDADFEFSVGSRPMMAAPADQLFSKGRILPLREAAAGGRGPVTLRDELREHDANDRHRRAARPASGTRWKELLGLRKAHRKGAAESAGEGAPADAPVDLGDHGETGE